MLLETGILRAGLRPLRAALLRPGCAAASSAASASTPTSISISRMTFSSPARMGHLRALSTRSPAPSFARPSRLARRLTTAAMQSTSPSAASSAAPSAFAVGAGAGAGTQQGQDEDTTTYSIPRSLPNWLLGCSGLVFGIIVIGGLTRLTESGLSITEWQPLTGVLPPITDEEWAVEWDKYKVSPEGIMMNANISMPEFKKIFYMEWAHRIAGRVLGIAFIVPTIYYMTRYRLPKPLPFKLLAIGLGIGFQGALGWYMVKSGLEQEIIDTNAVPRVSQYRLAAHLSAALLLYVGMLSTAIGIKRDLRGAVPSPLAPKRLTHLALGLVFLTAVSGAFVAGLDAGLVYNEFPTMGGRLMPPTDELMDPRYAKQADKSDTWWRNLLENPVTAQFDHRVLATTTFCLLLTLPYFARRAPRDTRRWAKAVAGAAVAQVTLGITTLLYLVPTHVAATHQAGSVVLLTCLLGLAGTMRRPGRAARLLRTVPPVQGR